jgi:hypothetical protein
LVSASSATVASVRQSRSTDDGRLEGTGKRAAGEVRPPAHRTAIHKHHATRVSDAPPMASRLCTAKSGQAGLAALWSVPLHRQRETDRRSTLDARLSPSPDAHDLSPFQPTAPLSVPLCGPRLLSFRASPAKGKQGLPSFKHEHARFPASQRRSIERNPRAIAGK